MNKKIWIPIVYIVLTLGVMYLSNIVTFNILQNWEGEYNYMNEAIPKANTIAMLLSLIVIVYLFVVLRHLFYKYPPLQVLYISQIIIVLLGGLTYVTFTSIENYNAALIAFYGLSFVSSLIGFVVYFVLILHPNTTTSMKYCLIPMLVIGLFMNVASTLIQVMMRIGLLDALEQIMIIQGQVSFIVYIITILLTAGWLYLMLDDEEQHPNIHIEDNLEDEYGYE